VRTYVVRPGDSPAKIAIQFAGCPKCAVDLIKANPHKEAVRYPNGFLSFRELRAGEKLELPEKWFSGALDRLPPAYFAALPHPDGVTLPKGRFGTLGDYATLEQANLAVSSLASKADDAFVIDAKGAADLIDEAVQEVRDESTTAKYAQPVKTATDWARAAALDLLSAIQDGDKNAATSARLDTQNALSTALGAAQISLEAYYAKKPPYEIDIGPATIEPPAPAPAPAPAPPPASPPAASAPAPAPAPAPVASITPPQTKGVSTGAVVGTLLGVSVVAGGIYWVVNHPPRKRVRRVGIEDDRETS